MTTMKLAEYKDAVESYEQAYEAGLTRQPCTHCGRPVVERDANWDFYAGAGTLLHPWCVGGHLYAEDAQDWWILALDDYLKNVEDIRTLNGFGQFYGDTRSYAALLEKNRREYPGDRFFDRPPDPWKWPVYAEIAMRRAGVCSWQNGVPF